MVKTVRPRLTSIDTRSAKPPAKSADPFYLTPSYRAWRDQVIERAGARCEWVEGGRRCTKAAPKHRMFADHIREVKDGGAKLDPANGMCLCGSHHTVKTARQRAQRLATPV